MNRNHVRAGLCAGAAGLLGLFATACGSSEDAPAGAKNLSFELTDQGCLPHQASAPAGPIAFEAENTGSSKVTEIEVMEGDTILGEKENLSEGLSGSFSLTLDAGKYTIYCPGGDAERGTLTVSGELKAKGSAKADAAVADYREYLEENANHLVLQTKPFVAAVVAGNVSEAKSLYPLARAYYERIEPVAESFGDLDPRIDAPENENDLASSEFGGFHRIEKALWQEGSAEAIGPVARQLQADVEELAEEVETVDLQAVQIANGADELLDEVSASKITGEEERYSHTDLVDFEANVEGAEAAFEAVKPLPDESDPELSGELEADFKMVFAELQPYRKGNGFVSYTELTRADTRKLAQSIETLAEKLGRVPAAIAAAEGA
ncbi:MAG: iron uptake system protein EfeO [Solirubrobacterales bacterium]